MHPKICMCLAKQSMGEGIIFLIKKWPCAISECLFFSMNMTINCFPDSSHTILSKCNPRILALGLQLRMLCVYSLASFWTHTRETVIHNSRITVVCTLWSSSLLNHWQFPSKRNSVPSTKHLHPPRWYNRNIIQKEIGDPWFKLIFPWTK